MNYFLHYTIGNIRFATPIEEIKEIVRPKTIISDGEIGKNLSGYFDLRGQKVVLYDLPGFLGISIAEGFEVIIAEIQARNIGFKVSKVSGIISTEDIKPFPAIVKAKDYFQGVVKDEDDFLQIISFAKLLSGSRLSAVKKFLES